MLAKRYRLPIQSVVKKSGRISRGRYFLLKEFANNLNYNRFGVIISKKTSKKSTDRNKLKRIILDSVKDFLFHGDKKTDFLIIVSPQLIKLTPPEIKREIKNIFKN